MTRTILKEDFVDTGNEEAVDSGFTPDKFVGDTTIDPNRFVDEEPSSEKPSMLSNMIRPLKRVGQIYMEEVSSGEQAMKQALEKPTGKSILGGFLGALQYGFAPLTAGVKGIIKEPVQDNLKNAGVPENVADFAGDMVETAAYFVPYGKAVQTAIVGQKAMREAAAIKSAMSKIPKIKTTLKPTTIKKKLEFPKDISQEAIDETLQPISESAMKILKTSVVDDVIERTKGIVEKSWDPTQKRITQEIVDYMDQNPAEIEKIARVYKLSPEQLTAQIKETMTLSGGYLGRMGRLAKTIKKKFNTPYMKQLTEYMEKELPEIPAMDKFGNAFRTIENVRRASLVSQFVTTFRNIGSQGARVAMGSVDDAFQGAGNAFLKSGGEVSFSSLKSTLRGFGEGLDLFNATLGRLSKAEKKNLVKILNADNAIQAKVKMFTTPVHDVVLTGKYSKYINILNRTQEYFFRNIAFQAKLKQLSKNAGLDFKNLKPSDFPEKMLTEAAEYSLDMTFAAMPKSKFGQEWVKAMTNPILTALANPFPRFLYGNALPFLKRFSPLGFIEAASPKTMAGIVSGNPEKFTKAISEATIGTMMLNTAFYIRNSKYGGEKWYEVRVGKKTYDTRAYAPLTTYLFMAEALQNPERLKPADFGSALLSLNRIGGTGLVLSDILRGKTADTTIHTMKRLVGAWLSGFTVPARTPKDIYTAVDPEEAIIRDVKDDELWGPSVANIPEVSQRLPERKTPLKVGKLKTESPIFRQFTGLSYITKSELQKEVDRVQLNYSRIYPRTGDAKGDRIVSQIMAPVLEESFKILLNNSNYQEMDIDTQRVVLGILFTDAKKEARTMLLKIDPETAMKIKIENIPDNLKKVLDQHGVSLTQ